MVLDEMHGTPSTCPTWCCSSHQPGDGDHVSADVATNGDFVACIVQRVEFVDGRVLTGEKRIHLAYRGNEVLWGLSEADCSHAAGTLTVITPAERASAAVTLSQAADWLRQTNT